MPLDANTDRARFDDRVSVVIPAKNEETSVGDVVRQIRADLTEPSGSGLVDEVVVIDSDSTDETAHAALAAGAKVFASAAIRPDLGSRPGKGEALWKSQFVARGEILVFIDADLVEWGTHFVTRLVEPLHNHESIHLVKAKYDRPMIDARGRVEDQGGRVTELVARPWLALHRPELSRVVQPLSGEWAIRRSTFSSYAVPVGYGVEIAALLDTADFHGGAAIAQADLGRRTHRHHRHDVLGQMAVQVLAAAENRRCRDRAWRPGPGRDETAPTQEVGLSQFGSGSMGFAETVSRVAVGERAPAATYLDNEADRSGVDWSKSEPSDSRRPEGAG